MALPKRCIASSSWMPRRRWPWCALLCLLLAMPALAVPALRDYAIDRWTSLQGLPHNSIRAIAQTPEGHLWFGTWEGLVGYNGLEFKVLDRSTRPGLRDNGIGALLADQIGGLWLSDSRGNVGYRSADGALRFVDLPDDAPRVLIQAMALDSQDRLWLLYEGQGLSRLDPDGRLHYFPPRPESPLGMANTRMVIDAQDRLWIGSFGGLVQRESTDDAAAQLLSPALKLPPGLAWPYQSPDGQLWTAAEDSLFRRVDQRLEFVQQIPGRGRLTAMLQDRRGQLWLGTENHGLLRLTDEHGLERLPENLDLPGGRITQLFEDAEGSIWAGANGGLFRLRETLFSNYTRRDGLNADYVRTVMQDSQQRLWIGSAGGLNWLDSKGKVQSQSLPTDSGNPPSILSLAEDAEANVWIGTYGDGLYRLRLSGEVHRYGDANGIPRGNIRAIAVDEAGTVWLATQRGVVKLQGESATAIVGEDAPAGLTTALYNQAGAIWVGTIEGARVIRGAAIERVDLDHNGGGRSVFGFRQVGEDMWMITDRGLYRYRGGALARVGLEQGMPVDATFQMVVDRTQHVWITSNRGVMRTSLAELNAVADGDRARLRVERYNEMDGMVSAQANGSSGPSAWLGSDGRLWIATANGLSVVDSQRAIQQPQVLPPPSVIEEISVEGQRQSFGAADDAVSLPGGKRINVSYVALSYLMPERIVYRTRLEGLDSDWIERGRQRNVEFLNLAPGDYALHVSAAHPGGAWGAREAVWKFRVEPFWWQRPSVQVGLLALSLAVLWGLYRIRVARYRAANARLSQLVEARTSDLQAQAQQLREADREKSQLLEKLREQSDAFARQAREDALTLLPNRRAFDQALNAALTQASETGQCFSLAMLDVDHFKEVNDRYSHTAGDEVLRDVAKLLIESCRENDVFARFGGEEFVLLFHQTSQEQAKAICLRLQRQFHQRSDWAGIEGLKVYFSAGLVEWRRGSESGAQLLERADAALYQAKQGGRDRICLG